MALGQPGSGTLPGEFLPAGEGEGGGVVELAVPSVMALAATGSLFVPTAMALSKVPPLAASSPARPTQMPAILAAFPPSLYDHNPRAVPALTIAVGASWRVDGDLLEVSGGAVPFACDLRDFTLGALATALTTAGYTATAASAWSPLAATVLVDGSGRLDEDARLYAFTTVLYRLLRSVVLVWDRLADDLDDALRQLDLRLATGVWLDWWGALYGVPRDTLENDARYRARIVYSTLRPRTNNVAIKAALKAILDIDAAVDDVTPAGPFRLRSTNLTALDRTYAGQVRPGRYWPGYPVAFTVTVAGATDDPTIARIARLVDRWKAAGVVYTIVRS